MAKEFTVKGLDYFFKREGNDLYGRSLQDTEWFKVDDDTKNVVMSKNKETKKQKTAAPKVNSKLSKSLKNLKRR
tara:strand:+ start:145 stop:366 length:222 start_codon:yes stop_codon:yes gene_type:complete